MIKNKLDDNIKISSKITIFFTSLFDEKYSQFFSTILFKNKNIYYFEFYFNLKI